MMIESAGMMHMPPAGFSAEVTPPQQLYPWFVHLSGIFMILVLVVGFNATIKLSIKGQVEEQKNKELKKENSKPNSLFYAIR